MFQLEIETNNIISVYPMNFLPYSSLYLKQNNGNWYLIGSHHIQIEDSDWQNDLHKV